MADVPRAWSARIRTERKARGWDKPEMARQLARAAGMARASLPSHDSLLTYVKRWERGGTGISERYRLLYARALGIPENELFGPDDSGDDELTPDDEDRLTLVMVQPARLDAGALGALSAILAGQRRLEDAIGPAALIDAAAAQTRSITGLLRDATGPHRGELGRIVTDWTTFTGWLHAALRQDARALELFAQAEDLADDVDYGTGAALATSFRGYVARQQDRPRAVIRAAGAARATSGVHRTQQTFDALQAAQGHVALGDRERARRLLDEAANLADGAGDPPPAVYWYSESFFRLNIGTVLAGLGEYRDAADMLSTGLEGMPADQRGAEWLKEYEDAYADANDRA